MLAALGGFLAWMNFYVQPIKEGVDPCPPGTIPAPLANAFHFCSRQLHSLLITLADTFRTMKFCPPQCAEVIDHCLDGTRPEHASGSTPSGKSAGGAPETAEAIDRTMPVDEEDGGGGAAAPSNPEPPTVSQP